MLIRSVIVTRSIDVALGLRPPRLLRARRLREQAVQQDVLADRLCRLRCLVVRHPARHHRHLCPCRLASPMRWHDPRPSVQSQACFPHIPLTSSQPTRTASPPRATPPLASAMKAPATEASSTPSAASTAHTLPSQTPSCPQPPWPSSAPANTLQLRQHLHHHHDRPPHL